MCQIDIYHRKFQGLHMDDKPKESAIKICAELKILQLLTSNVSLIIISHLSSPAQGGGVGFASG